MERNRLAAVCWVVLMVCCGSAAVAQKKKASARQEIERVLRNVAGSIMHDTKFRIVDNETGETFEDSRGLPVRAGIRVESPYNEWRYWNGVMNLGFLSLGERLDEPQFVEYAKKNVAFAFDHDVFFRKCYDANLKTGMEQKFRMALLDDCGAMGAGVLAVHAVDPKDRYQAYAHQAADYMMNHEKRLNDGTFCRSVPYEMTVWGDDLYMSVPFLARMGLLTGERKYFDEAANQVLLFDRYLWEDKTGLFYHGWYDDVRQNGVAHWGRCNGWMIMAQVELLTHLPHDHPKRQQLMYLLTRQIVSLIRYQDASGLWHQLIDKEHTYLETSASAIFTYAIAKAINEGWLDNRYAHVAVQGWQGVSSKILADGRVEGICMGTGISTAVSYYANRPTPVNDIHGLGAVLLAGSEIIKLYENGIGSVWGL